MRLLTPHPWSAPRPDAPRKGGDQGPSWIGRGPAVARRVRHGRCRLGGRGYPRSDADQRANGVAGAKGAAAGELVARARTRGAAAYPPPSRCAGRFSAPLRGSLAMMARLRPRAGWRNARGIRRALPPYGEMADGAEAKFFKNAAAGERISAALLFQHQNDAVAAWSRRIFSYSSLSSLSQVRPQAERAVKLLALPRPRKGGELRCSDRS